MKLHLFGKRERKISFGLDIGTEAVKLIIFLNEPLEKDKENNKNKLVALSASLQYFDRYGVFDGKDLENDIIRKAISKAVDEAQKNLFLSSEIPRDVKEKVAKQKKWQVLLNLSADKLKGRIVPQKFIRKNPKGKIFQNEEKTIYQEILKKAQNEIGQTFAKEIGMLPQDLYWASLRILERKIDGYSVSFLQGYTGQNLEFKILTTFLPKYYLENIKGLIKNLGMKISKIVHPVENLPILCQGVKKDAIFFDIGGEVTQFFVVENGNLETINEIESGGKMFTEILSRELGIDEESARILKERYSDKNVNIETAKKIREMFASAQQQWFLDLKAKIEKIAKKEFFLSNVYLFGGGSLLPEIKEILEEKMAVGLNEALFFKPYEIKFLYPNDLKNIENLAKNFKNPQSIPSLLICYSPIENYL